MVPVAPSFEWPSTRLQRVPMSFDDWMALPEEVRAEWVDGVALVSPAPALRHQRITGDLRELLKYALPDLIVVHEGATRTADRRYRIPDVVAFRAEPATTAWLTEAPVVVVEVLSPSTRSEDQLVKSAEYLAAGVSQYWVLDPDRRDLVVLRAAEGEWTTGLVLDDERPTGTVEVGEHGTVEVDLVALLDG